MKYIALVPSYQPVEDQLIPLLKNLLSNGFSVVLVNDGSGEKYQHIFDKIPDGINLISYEGNQGKGHALKTGLDYIKNNFSNDCMIVTMDSDGQHKIEDALKILAIAEQNPNSLVLGSRKLNKNCPLRSRVGNKLARLSFSLATRTKLYDTQTGLRAFSFDLIDEFKEIKGERYEYEMNVLLHCTKRKIAIIEEFIETIYIDSNSNSHYNPLKDSLKIIKELIKFSGSSLIGFFTDYAFYSLFIFLNFGLTASNVVARIISASVNFLINYFFVFKSKGGFIWSLLKYAALAIFILACNTGILRIFVYNLGLNELVAKIIVEITMFFVSWLIQRLYVFKKR